MARRQVHRGWSSLFSAGGLLQVERGARVWVGVWACVCVGGCARVAYGPRPETGLGGASRRAS